MMFYTRKSIMVAILDTNSKIFKFKIVHDVFIQENPLWWPYWKQIPEY